MRHGPRIFAWSLLAGATWGVIAGAALEVRFSYGLSRFGGLEWVPAVVGLAAIRGVGPWMAALVPTLTAIVILQRAAKRGETANEPSLPLFVGGATVALYPVVVLFLCLTALALWIRDTGSSARTFMTLLVEHVLLMDVVFGALATAVYGLVITVAIRFARTSLSSLRWPLFPKLLVAWLALQALYMATSFAGRWFG